MFFAISGFVLTQAVQKSSPGPFLAARALRLYPGFWLATVLYAVVIACVGWPDLTPLAMRLANIGWTLRPGEYGTRLFILGVEWSLIYEAVLYVWLAAMSRLGTKRWLPFAAIVWLVGIGVKVALWPGYAMNSPASPLPSWETVLISAVNTPFFFGVLVFSLRERGRRLRWPVFAGLVAYVAIVPGRFQELESIWIAHSFAAAGFVWFIAQIRQLNPENRLVVAGEYSYGLYLVHTPVIMGVFAILMHQGWLVGSGAGVVVAGVAAIAFGLVFGKLESALHLRLRPLLKVRLADSFIARACVRIVRAAGSLLARPSGRLAGSR